MLCSVEYRTAEESEYSAIPSVAHHRQMPSELNCNRPDNRNINTMLMIRCYWLKQEVNYKLWRII
jgi:hypothetical protein